MKYGYQNDFGPKNFEFTDRDFHDAALKNFIKKMNTLLVFPYNAKFSTASAILLLRWANKTMGKELSYTDAMQYVDALVKTEGYGSANLTIQEIRCRIDTHDKETGGAMLSVLDAFIAVKNATYQFRAVNACVQCFVGKSCPNYKSR
ncbi:MAG: hypothetical protein FWC51_04560 [Proteobacteria bacterium]|nr:hypothetical protein [Pseudomonadota bacterium]